MGCHAIKWHPVLCVGTSYHLFRSTRIYNTPCSCSGNFIYITSHTHTHTLLRFYVREVKNQFKSKIGLLQKVGDAPSFGWVNLDYFRSHASSREGHVYSWNTHLSSEFKCECKSLYKAAEMELIFIPPCWAERRLERLRGTDKADTLIISSTNTIDISFYRNRRHRKRKLLTPFSSWIIDHCFAFSSVFFGFVLFHVAGVVFRRCVRLPWEETLV